MTNANRFSLRDAVRFWERGRIFYNAALALVVVLWIILTWPHFRPSLTLGSLEAMFILALLANVCYTAAYIADFVAQFFLHKTSRAPLLPDVATSAISLRRFRLALFLLGTLLALVLENYWIVDEIYPYPNDPPSSHLAAAFNMSATFPSNMNFPAPLAVIGFLAAIVGLFIAVAATLIFWFARKPRLARTTAVSIAAGAVIYFALLLGFSAASRTTTLPRGEEKYFCEIDCHLAYSIVDVTSKRDDHAIHCTISLRTRFDETTTSPNRPKDAPLSPSPREVRLVDSLGREYSPRAISGTSLQTPLKPADSYLTQLEFTLPADARGLRLLLSTTPGWPDHFVIGDENSWLHNKTYFAL